MVNGYNILYSIHNAQWTLLNANKTRLNLRSNTRLAFHCTLERNTLNVELIIVRQLFCIRHKERRSIFNKMFSEHLIFIIFATPLFFAL